MPRYDANDPELQQRVGKWTNIVILLVAIFAVSRCISKSPEEKFTACFVKEMRGQGEHMREAVGIRCQQKTGYGLKK